MLQQRKHGQVDGFGFGLRRQIDDPALTFPSAQVPVSAEIWITVPRVQSAGSKDAAGDQFGAGFDEAFQVIIGTAVETVIKDSDAGSDIRDSCYLLLC